MSTVSFNWEDKNRFNSYPKAILFSHICYWQQHNRKGGLAKKHGVHWVFRKSSELYHDMNGEIPEDVIKKYTRALVLDGHMISGHFHTNSSDRTTWYHINQAIVDNRISISQAEYLGDKSIYADLVMSKSIIDGKTITEYKDRKDSVNDGTHMELSTTSYGTEYHMLYKDSNKDNNTINININKKDSNDTSNNEGVDQNSNLELLSLMSGSVSDDIPSDNNRNLSATEGIEEKKSSAKRKEDTVAPVYEIKDHTIDGFKIVKNRAKMPLACLMSVDYPLVSNKGTLVNTYKDGFRGNDSYLDNVEAFKADAIKVIADTGLNEVYHPERVNQFLNGVVSSKNKNVSLKTRSVIQFSTAMNQWYKYTPESDLLKAPVVVESTNKTDKYSTKGKRASIDATRAKVELFRDDAVNEFYTLGKSKNIDSVKVDEEYGKFINFYASTEETPKVIGWATVDLKALASKWLDNASKFKAKPAYGGQKHLFAPVAASFVDAEASMASSISSIVEVEYKD